MVLVISMRTWTWEVCSLYLFCNMFTVTSLNTDKKKEPLFITDDKVFQKRYRLEDFFWTGSGDGPVTEDLFNNETDTEINAIQSSPFDLWRTTTVFHTTTILFATVYPDTDNCVGQDCKPQISTVQTGSIDFSLSAYPPLAVPDIQPSPTQQISFTNTLKIPKSFFNEIEGKSFDAAISPLNTSDVSRSSAPKTDLEGLDITTTPVFPEASLDQKYWIMTVLKRDNYLPSIELNFTENRLSSLYRKAFSRRQEKIFRDNDYRDRRERKISQPVQVHILNVTCTGSDNVEIIYCVTVAGKPIPAMSAANDMRLLTASEVIAELGYPILTKAEPYIKRVVPLGARVNGRTRDTWLLIGSVIAAVLLLIILAAFLALGLSINRSKKNRDNGIENQKQIFEEEEEGGRTNLAFQEDINVKGKNVSRRRQTKHEESVHVGGSTGTTVKFTEEERRGSTTSSSCSGSSEASLVRLRHQQRKKERKRDAAGEKPKPKPRTLRRVESSDCNNCKSRGYARSASSAFSRNTFDEITTEGCEDIEYSPRLTRSPTSYLSMPSVRAFPRGTKIPEPLNKILEPTSIRHLDADSDSPTKHPQLRVHRQEINIHQICETKNKYTKGQTMTRHASLEGDDPGFIGPVVWNRHCRKISEGDSDLMNVEETEDNVNVGRMRKRFNELLDDALSMFGSRNGSPSGSDVVPVRQPDNRIHSAVIRPAGLSVEETGGTRPKTTGSRRPQSSVISGPRGAWETPSCSTLARPVSAGEFRKSSPTIDRNLIHVNSDLAPSDPAIPLIAAIKNELKKFEDPT